MNECERYLLAIQLVHESQTEISHAILAMFGRDVWVVLRHLIAAKAYLNAAKSWCESDANYYEPITRRLDEVIEAVSKKRWKEAWRPCWELLQPQELLASYHPDAEPPWDEQGSGDRDEGDIA
jgi:hypothetical protein